MWTIGAMRLSEGYLRRWEGNLSSKDPRKNKQIQVPEPTDAKATGQRRRFSCPRSSSEPFTAGLMEGGVLIFGLGLRGTWDENNRKGLGIHSRCLRFLLNVIELKWQHLCRAWSLSWFMLFQVHFHGWGLVWLWGWSRKQVQSFCIRPGKREDSLNYRMPVTAVSYRTNLRSRWRRNW